MSLTGLLFMMTYLGGLGLAFARGPIFGLWTYMAVFYLHPPSRWWGVGLPPMRWALFAALVTLIALIIQNGRDKKQSNNEVRPDFFSHGFSVYFLIFVVWMWLQAPWVLSPVHMDGVILFTKYLLMIYLIYSIVKTEEQIVGTVVVHMVGCVYLGWLAFNAGGGGRLEGVGGPGIDDSNSMSMQLGTAVLGGAALMLRERQWFRLGFLMIMMPLILNGMVQGNSRGAYVGLVCAGLLVWWMKPKDVKARFTLFASVAVVGLLAVAPVTFWERISTLTAATDDDKEFDNSASSRIVIMKAQFEMFADYPLGAGHKGTAELSADYMDDAWLTNSNSDPNAGRARASHNTYLSVMVDHGIVGVILMIMILLWTYRTIRKCRRRLRKNSSALLVLVAIGGALTMVGAAGMFAPYLKAEVMYWFLALLMSISVLPDRSRQTDNEPEPVKSDRGRLRSAGY
ncbi:MAG: O-antigen ligase family protein [Woeseiaceae bacterium]